MSRNRDEHGFGLIFLPPGSIDLLQNFAGSGAYSRLIAFWATWYMDRNSTLTPTCCLPNLKKPARHCASLLVGEVTKCYNLSCTLEKESQYAPPHWIPWNFTEMEGHWIFVRFIFHSWVHTFLTSRSREVAFCSLGSISQHTDHPCNRPVWHLVKEKNNQVHCELNYGIGLKGSNAPEVWK